MYKGQPKSVALVIVLSVITCGIYTFYWLYRTEDDLKAYLQDESINPGLDLLLSILCVPYIIYLAYKYGKLIVEAQKLAGIQQEDNSVLYLILSIFGFSIVSFGIMQSQLNKVWQS